MGMGKAPLFVRPPTDAERQALEDSLRSPDAFVLRRAQIILASARGETAGAIAPRVGFSGQAVRTVIRAFNRTGLAVLRSGSHRNHVIYSCLDTAGALALRDLLHRSPRDFDKPTGVWTLDLAAEVAYAQGLTAWRVSGETIRATLARMGVRWRRAKEWITSPDPEYARKKARRDRLIRLAQAHPDWLLGFEDEVWWSRLAHPTLYTWQDGDHPWRNPIEPKWLAGKKRVAEPARLLSAPELEERVCAAFGCDREPHLIQPPPTNHKSKKAA